MKKTMVILFVGLLCLSMFSMFEQNVQATSSGAYLSDFVQLTTSPYRDRMPCWSPDGSRIAYFEFDSSDWYRHIWSMTADGNQHTQITFGNVLDEMGDYSPDGTQITFIRNVRGNDRADIMVMDSDGTNVQPLTSTGLHHGHARWSNDGQRLAFYYGGAGTNVNEIHIMNADGTNEVTVVASSYSHLNPYWSPDDTKLVYTMDDGLWLVETLPPYTKTHLFTTSLPTMHCAYSPDGEYILYGSGIMGQPQNLYLVDANGNFVAQLTTDTTIEYPFEWSPDGHYIAFGSTRSGNTDIWRALLVETPAIQANVDIDPNALNLGSKGKWITSYIELPEGYAVTDIDVSTIMLNGTIQVDASAPTCIGDYDTDGIQDLMVKFDRAAGQQYILDNVPIEAKFMTATLTITGELNDGTLFQGSDTIKIILPINYWKIIRLEKLGIA